MRKINQSMFAELVAIVGEAYVKSTDADVELLSRTTLPERHIPSYIVYPETAEQVSAIVRMANKIGIAVWYVSKGFNWGYGSSSACYDEGITLVLERMNKIHHVDEELGYTVIEPGVTYKQLDDHLKQTGSRLWADCAGSTAYASVLGNALDRGRGLTPYSDHFAALCGMEVVLPTGDVLVTGGGPSSTENFPTWNIYKWGTGPYLDGLFSQSNLGIVVKAGLWLMPAPEKYDFFVFEYEADQEKFPYFINDLRNLLLDGTIKAAPHVANAFAMLCIVSQYPKGLSAGQTRLSNQALKQWQSSHGIADWTFGCALYGTKGEVRANRSVIKKRLSRYGSLTFAQGVEEDTLKSKLMLRLARVVLKLKGKSVSMLEGLPHAVNLFKGIPTDHFVKQVYFRSHAEKPSSWSNPAQDGCGFIWIGPVVPFKADSLSSLTDPVVELYKQYEFDYFVELIIANPRSLIVLFGIFYDKASEEESARAKQLYDEIYQLARDKGFPPYRATIMSMSRVLDQNAVLKDVVEKIKDTLDPNHVLAPGKYGCGSPPPGR